VIGFLIYLALLGLVAGGLARWAVPGPDPMGILGTIGLGLGGSFLGGLLAYFLLGHAGGFLFAVLGSIVLLILYRKFVQHRPITGPGARRLPPR
jgi:uncharacterized membrane protein YeaQ/YmgE (transglycosylase-associated protein family)